uniref:Sulfate_transp domain-containing protein n=1 Tax=Macrostomum lignano TaxID=282301 RepID=A0A1I8JRF6_9PLAT
VYLRLRGRCNQQAGRCLRLRYRLDPAAAVSGPCTGPAPVNLCPDGDSSWSCVPLNRTCPRRPATEPPTSKKASPPPPPPRRRAAADRRRRDPHYLGRLNAVVAATSSLLLALGLGLLILWTRARRLRAAAAAAGTPSSADVVADGGVGGINRSETIVSSLLAAIRRPPTPPPAYSEACGGTGTGNWAGNGNGFESGTRTGTGTGTETGAQIWTRNGTGTGTGTGTQIWMRNETGTETGTGTGTGTRTGTGAGTGIGSESTEPMLTERQSQYLNSSINSKRSHLASCHSLLYSPDDRDPPPDLGLRVLIRTGSAFSHSQKCFSLSIEGGARHVQLEHSPGSSSGGGKLGSYSRRNSLLRSGTTTPRLPPPQGAELPAEDAENRLRRTLEIYRPAVGAPGWRSGGKRRRRRRAARRGGAGQSGPIGVEGENVMESVSPWPGEVGMVEIKRPVYSQPQIRERLPGGRGGAAAQAVHRQRLRAERPEAQLLRHRPQLLPCMRMLREYRVREYLPLDLVSGLSTGIMRIPQSMAYALLAYLSPVYGLYTAFVAGVIYCILGTSPHLVMSCQGVVSLMVGQVPCMRFMDRTYRRNLSVNATTPDGGELSAASAEVILDTVLVVSLLRPAYRRLHHRAAIEVISSQVSAVVGYKRASSRSSKRSTSRCERCQLQRADADHLWVLDGVPGAVQDGHSRLNRYCKAPIPGELIITVVVTLISYLADFNDFGVDQVGHVPQGFKEPRVPQLQLADGKLVQDSVVIAIKFALEYDTEIDANQEFLAYGAGNLVGSFTNCFVSTSSMSCSALHESLGGRTQVANLFASALVLVTILFLGPTFKTTPNCVLSAIILVNLKSMLWQFGDLPQLWDVTSAKSTSCSGVVTCASVICFSVDTGLIIGWPYACILGRIPHTDIYKNIVELAVPADRLQPRQLAIKQHAYDQKLRNLRLTVKEAIPILQNPAPGATTWEVEAQESRQTNYGSVSAALTVGDLRPSTSLHHLRRLRGPPDAQPGAGRLREAGVTVYLSNTRAAVRLMLGKPRVSKVDMKKIFLTNHDAVSAALSEAQKIEEKNWLDFDSMAAAANEPLAAAEVPVRQPDLAASAAAAQPLREHLTPACHQDSLSEVLPVLDGLRQRLAQSFWQQQSEKSGADGQGADQHKRQRLPESILQR